MKKITNIVILAGGNGDRFWPMKEKFLIPFMGKTLLEHFLDRLAPFAEHVYVIGSGSNKDTIKKLITGRAELLLQEKLDDGMAGAVLACKGHVHGDTLIMGNDFIDFSVIDSLVQRFNETGANIVFLAKKMNGVYFPGGYLELDNGKIKGLVEKPAPENIPSDFVRMVVDYYRDIDTFISIIEKIEPGEDEWYELAMNEFIHRGEADYVVYDGFWQALKYPWHILRMDKIMRESLKGQHIDESAYISDNAVIEGDVYIGKDCKIGNFVKVSGPCYIGDKTIIGDYSLVRESSVGSNVLIGSGCEVARSYICDNASLHRNYVGDSLLGKGVLFGAGAVTANFRFDQKNVFSFVGGKKINTDSNKLGALIGEGAKIGINTTLFPGVKVGVGSVVAPGEIISQDIPDNTFVANGTQKPNKL